VFRNRASYAASHRELRIIENCECVVKLSPGGRSVCGMRLSGRPPRHLPHSV